MTTLYRPVLIESAEQAEALPRGTVATYGKGSAKLTAHRVTVIAVKPDAWLVMDDFLSSSDMVGWTALVPIEAEEEWTVGQEDPSWAPGTESWARRFQAQEPGRRLFRRSVTPWEEA